MEPLTEEQVDRTWEEFASFTPEQAYSEAYTVGEKQPEMLAFVVEMTEDMEQEVRELAIYMFYVIYRMFQNGYGRDIEEVSSDEVIKCYEENERLMERLEGAHDKFFESVAKVQMSAQPYVVRYVVETLYEAGQADEPILTGEEEMGYLFLLMKTVIDALDRKTDR